MTRRPERRCVARWTRRCLAAALLLCAVPATAADIVPHGATYELALRELRMDAAAAKSEGRLLLSIGRICEGWRISTRLEFRVATTDGRVLQVETINGVEESTDGDLLSFATLSRLNGEIQSETEGAATVKPDSGGRVIFTTPSRRELALPQGTMFPAAGARLLLDRLIAGRTQVQRKIFDGSTPDPLEVLETVARGRLAPGRAPTGDGGNLLAAASWRLQSLWTRGGGRETVQKMEVQLHANGVTSRMIIDLGVIVLDARLTDIRRLTPPSC